MIFVIYTALSLACSLILCIFSFWIGRCARRIPIIDRDLPWTMSREQIVRRSADSQATCIPPTESPRWPETRLAMNMVNDISKPIIAGNRVGSAQDQLTYA